MSSRKWRKRKRMLARQSKRSKKLTKAAIRRRQKRKATGG